jgi:hypothetical protein
MALAIGNPCAERDDAADERRRFRSEMHAGILHLVDDILQRTRAVSGGGFMREEFNTSLNQAGLLANRFSCTSAITRPSPQTADAPLSTS